MGSTDSLVDLVRALSRMSGYEDGFFQTGRNNAEARFWKLKIHEEVDRRQTKSSISLGGNGVEASNDDENVQDREKSPSPYSKYDKSPADSGDYKYSYAPSQPDYSNDYHTYYPDPRDRSLSIVSTMSSRARPFTGRTDFKYSYPGEIDEEEKEQIEEKHEKEDLIEKKPENNEKPTKKFNSDEENETKEDETQKKSEKYFLKDAPAMQSIRENQEQQSAGHISSRFY